jgi:hypothetical protein
MLRLACVTRRSRRCATATRFGRIGGYTEWAEGTEGAQLYDMDKDPRETQNLVSDAAHASTVADLKARLRAYRR